MRNKLHKAKTVADNVAASVESRNTIPRRKCANTSRRKRLEANPQEWLRWYLAGTYSRPFEKPHEEIIAGTVEAADTGGRFVVAAERGIGKSAVLWGMILYVKLTGRRRFPVCVPWADKALKRAFRFWKNALCFNARLKADYPEFCDPFAHSKGVAQRVPNVRWGDTGELTGAQLTVGEGLIVLPDNLGCLGGSTINGNIRGLNHPMEDGTLLRPDIVLLDDVQDRKVAKSPFQVRDTIHIINGDVAGCGDAGRDLPMLMACNCIVKGDVAEHYLNDAEWKALRVPCIVKWPDRWNDKGSAARAAWDDWAEVWREGGDDMAFYEAHREAMTGGMELSAPAAFAGSEKCPDAFYGVIRMYYRMGETAFMAERQQEPIEEADHLGPWTLTPAIIQARSVRDRKPYDRPSWVSRIYASTDINPSRAFTTTVVGFGEDQSAAVLWYGIQPVSISDEMPAPMFARELFNALAEYGRKLASLPIRPESWAIDCGGKQFDGVLRFAAESAVLCGLDAHGFRGTGWKSYTPDGKTARKGDVREMCHGCTDMKDGRRRTWVAWHSDYWKEVAQRAWLGEAGGSGTASLFAGDHGEFAAQVCGDKIVDKRPMGNRMAWYFVPLPGRNDYGDSMAQAFALAAYKGIGTGGMAKRKKTVSVYAGGQWITNKGAGTNETKTEKEQGGTGGGKGSEGAGGVGSGAADGAHRPVRRALIGRPGGGRW